MARQHKAATATARPEPTNTATVTSNDHAGMPALRWSEASVEDDNCVGCEGAGNDADASQGDGESGGVVSRRVGSDGGSI